MTAHRLIHRLRRGSAELFAVVLLGTVAIMALTVWYASEIRRQTETQRMDTGAIFAAWTRAAHRATQENDYAPVLAAGGGLLTPAGLRAAGAAPLGLPEALKGAAMTLGVIDDGNGVAMAFAILTPDRLEALPQIRTGISAAGITALERASGPAGPMARHRAAIEAATGAALDTTAVYVTADTLPVTPHTLYRREQPGRPWLTEMNAGLDLDEHDITGATSLTATAATTMSTALAASLLIEGAVTAPSLAAKNLDAARIQTEGRLLIAEGLIVGTLITPGAVTAAAATITGSLQAAGLDGGALAAQDVTLSGDAEIADALMADDVDTATITGNPAIGTARITATGVFGPLLDITGLLTAGGCDGC